MEALLLLLIIIVMESETYVSKPFICLKAAGVIHIAAAEVANTSPAILDEMCAAAAAVVADREIAHECSREDLLPLTSTLTLNFENLLFLQFHFEANYAIMPNLTHLRKQNN